MSNSVLANKDVNAAMEHQVPAGDVKSMEYHRQVFQSKMADQPYVPVAITRPSPSGS